MNRRLTSVGLAAALLVSALAVTAADSPAPPADSAVAVGESRVSGADAVRVRSDHRVAAIARRSTVTAGKRISIVGSVVTKPRRGKAKARPVLLAERRGGTWKVIARKRSHRVGAYSFTIKAGNVATTRVFRVQTTRFNGLRASVTRTLQVKVVKAPVSSPPTTPPAVPDAPELLPAGYVGLGDSDDWSYLFDEQGGSRWNPCATIRWAYNPSAQGYDALPDVKRAFARIAGISGLAFTYVGTTTWRFLGEIDDPAFQASAYDIGVGWADAAELPDLEDDVVGIGGGSGRSVKGADVAFRMDRGYLILDRGEILPGGFTQVGWGAVMMHEILHALGLGHAEGDLQLMYPALSSVNLNPGAGDITGMTEVGAASGCLS